MSKQQAQSSRPGRRLSARWVLALQRRLASALVIAPAVLAATYFGGPFYLLAVVLATYLALREVYALAQHAGWQPRPVLGYLLALLLLITFDADRLVGFELLGDWRKPMSQLIITACIVVPLSVAVLRRAPDRHALTGWVVTLGGCLYVAWLMGHYIALHQVGPAEAGRGWVFYVLVATWAYDTAAYFTGSLLGRHRFLPRISPNKTWEGVAGGTIAVVFVTMVSGLPLTFWGWQALPLWHWHAIPLALGVAAAAQLGDLAESLIKRQAGAKDAGDLIPGHGGMLDRIDSLLFTVLVVYYYVSLVIVPAG